MNGPRNLTLRLPVAADLFVSSDDRAVLFTRGFAQLYSVDKGRSFRQVHTLSYGGTPSADHTCFEDAHDRCRKHDVWRVGDSLSAACSDVLVLLDGEKIGERLYEGFTRRPVGFPPEMLGRLRHPIVTMNGRDYALDAAAIARHGLTPADVVGDKTGRIRCLCEHLVLGGTLMRRAACPSEVSYVPLPDIRVPAYLFRFHDGQREFVYVSAAKYNSSQESFRLYIGTGNSMRRVPVSSVQRFRDGGTTYVRTTEGTLFCPSPFKRTLSATWHKQPLEKLDPACYEISESNSGVEICCKGR